MPESVTQTEEVPEWERAMREMDLAEAHQEAIHSDPDFLREAARSIPTVDHVDEVKLLEPEDEFSGELAPMYSVFSELPEADQDMVISAARLIRDRTEPAQVDEGMRQIFMLVKNVADANRREASKEGGPKDKMDVVVEKFEKLRKDKSVDNKKSADEKVSQKPPVGGDEPAKDWVN